jgi:hypothetical protein
MNKNLIQGESYEKIAMDIGYGPDGRGMPYRL